MMLGISEAIDNHVITKTCIILFLYCIMDDSLLAKHKELRI